VDVARRSAWVVAAFAAALDLAAVVCAYGFVSLLTDVEVIANPEAGRLVGPAAIGASVAAVLLTLAHTLRRPDRMLPSVTFSALWSWVAAVVVAAIGYAFATGTLTAAALFGLGFGIGWFGLLIPALAAVVASFAVLVARGRSTGMERPRWPWERDDEE
jgi:hypothetical protein